MRMWMGCKDLEEVVVWMDKGIEVGHGRLAF
jgi:hypothetical protein